MPPPPLPLPPPPAHRREPLLELVSLQKASGCWPLEEALAAALGKSGEEVEAPKPAAVSHREEERSTEHGGDS